MIVKTAVAWLLEEDWPKWSEIDSQLPSYPVWLAKIEAAEASAQSAGGKTERVEVRPDEFADWCRQNDKPVDRSSRAGYAGMLLARKSTAH